MLRLQLTVFLRCLPRCRSRTRFRQGNATYPTGTFLAGNRKTQRRPDEILVAVLVPRRMENAVQLFPSWRTPLLGHLHLYGRGGRSGRRKRPCSELTSRSDPAPPKLSASRSEHTLQGLPFRRGIGSTVKPEHLTTLTPIDDVRATAVYRRDAS